MTRMKASRRSVSCAVLVMGSVAANVGVAHADEATADANVRFLAEVLVIGNRPTSLPTEIPTTIEGIGAEEIATTINATDAEDALKYFPSLLVRKRYIGDYDHAVLATRASGTGNSARSLVYADGILLSNLLGNGASFTPRWGLVTPEEIERVDVLYGPFSAAYPGNSVGAVVDYITRMPTHLEAHVRVSGFTQDYEDRNWGIDDRYSGYQGSASVGNRHGAFSWWANFNHLDSDGQPIVFANKPLSSGTTGTGGLPVTGALLGRNPRNEPWWILGSTTQTHTIQDHTKVKLAFDFTDSIRASYTLGVWLNDAERRTESYLRDAAGNPVYSGTSVGGATTGPNASVINIGGSQYSLTPADFTPNRGDLRHLIHGLTVKSFSEGTWDWEVSGSFYDYDKDQVRSPTVATPTFDSPGAGRIVDMDGTKWMTFSAKGVWRPIDAHLIDFGYQRDAQQLRSEVFATTDWISGGKGARVSLFGGRTELQSVYAQDTWRFLDNWRATLGGRLERWSASDGVVSNNATTAFEVPGDRAETFFSPKAAVAYSLTDAWMLKASIGRAVRNPTVSELYQGSVAADQVVNNNPNLRAERSYTGELSSEFSADGLRLRATLFHEDTRDALYSQQQLSATGGTVNTVQNVQHIRTTGLELVAEKTDVGLTGLDLSSSVTYARSRIVENNRFLASVGKWQPRVPDWRANFLASYRMGEQWSFTFGTRYSGRQYNSLDNADPNGLSYTGVSKFLVMDIRARYSFTDHLRGSFGIDNLNNEEYWNFHNYPQRTLVAELGWDL